MGIRFTGVLGLMAIASPLVFIGSIPAQAQPAENPSAETLPTVAEAFDNAFFRNDETFYRNRQVPRNLTWFTGPFPENEIASDGRAVNRLYEDALAQQVSSDPIIRTLDAENPYQSSLLTAPIVPDEEPIPPAFSSPYSRSPVNEGTNNSNGNGNSGNGGSNAPVPALW